MSKYTITRACGHDETIQIYGKVVNRDRIADYETGKLCESCAKASLAAQNAQAAAANQASGLPALQGTPKQIAWAETIRAQAAAELAPIRAKMDGIIADASRPHAQRHAAAIAVEIIDATLARPSASAWIDTRGTSYSNAWIAARTKEALALRPAPAEAPTPRAIPEAASPLQAVKSEMPAPRKTRPARGVMARAWAIARQIHAAQGGSIKALFPTALKAAWAEIPAQ